VPAVRGKWARNPCREQWANWCETVEAAEGSSGMEVQGMRGREGLKEERSQFRVLGWI